MSDRERWIVYPLLFLALGISLRDKLTRIVETNWIQVDRLDGDVLSAELVRCRTLVVTDETNQPFVVVGTEYVGSSTGKVNRRPAGTIAVNGWDGKPQVVLGSNDTGGLVTVLDQERRLTLALGHVDVVSGLLAGTTEGKLIPWLPWFPRELQPATWPAPQLEGHEDQLEPKSGREYEAPPSDITRPNAATSKVNGNSSSEFLAP